MVGLQIDNIELMKFTNERENKVEYVQLTKALMAKNGRQSPPRFWSSSTYILLLSVKKC